MRQVGFLAIVVLGLLIAVPSERLNEAPSALAAEMTTNHARLEAVSFDGQGTVGQPLVSQASNFTSFSDGIEAFDDPNEGRSGDAEAFQNTTVNFTDPLAPVIQTTGGTEATWTDGETNDGKNPSASGRSEFTITFETSGGTFDLTGTIEATRSASNTNCAGVTVMPPDGATIQVSSCGSNQQDIDVSGDLAAGTHTFSVVATAAASNPGALGGTALATFNLNLSLTPGPLHSVEFTQAIQEWQPLSELLSDVQGDGQPPVPIVAGKPAAMRVYFEEVESTTLYDVQVLGEPCCSAIVELAAGCTPQQRRSGENNCRSVDFFFTPPSGNWSATLQIRNGVDGSLVEEHEFNLTSVEANPLILKPVTVCDNLLNPASGVWNCGSLFDLVNLLPFLRATFPGEVLVAGSGSTVYIDTAEVADAAEWWQALGDNIRALWTAEGAFENLHHYGVVRPQADAGTTGGVAFTEANAAAGRTSQLRDDMDGGLAAETAHELLAHLLGVNFGLGYAPSSGGCYGEPAGVDPGWPAGSPAIDEVGFDVAAGMPVPETHADWMSLCTPRWISPYTANNVIDSFGTGGNQVQAAGLTAGDFWLVSGLLNEDTAEAEFDPLFELETEGSVEEGTGLYRIEVRDATDAVLFTRFFEVDHSRFEDVGQQSAEGEAIVRFAELIPVQATAATIVMFSGSEEVGSIELGGVTPIVQLSSGASVAAEPAGAPPLPVFSWSVEDGDTSDHTFWIELSRDNGQTWQTIAPRFTGDTLSIDPAVVGGGQGMVLRVLASDGANTGSAESEPFVLQLQAPQGAIASPAGGSAYDPGDLVWLQAAVVDAEDGFLDGASVQWSSSRDGNLGTGASLPIYDLSSGSHTITMTAQDSDGHDVADSIVIAVSGEPTGDEHTWGDIDCNGAITSRDGQALLRNVLAQAPLSQTQPCPAVGANVTVGGTSRLWGDIDCNGAIGARDGQALLRKVLAQNALSQTQPCPPIGDTVTVASLAGLPRGWHLAW